MAAWLRRLSARVPAHYAIALLATLLFVWSHRHAAQMPGFAEDMGLVQSLSRAAQNGTLLDEIMQRILGPLWGAGSIMWRPWAFASLAADAWMYGAAPGRWHLTNLLLHLAAAGFTGLLAGTWLRSPWAAAVAYATMLLHPWSAEITMWLVGRFDGWTTAAIAACLYFSWRSVGFDRWFGLAAAATFVAYASKESALMLFPAVAMLLFARAVIQTPSASEPATARRIVPFARAAFFQKAKGAWPLLALQLTLLIAYFAIRWRVVGTLSTNVYGSSQVLSSGELLVRLLAHVQAFISIAHIAPSAAMVVAALAALAVATCFIVRAKTVLWFVAAWVTIVFAGAALHFRTIVGDGDGYRLYYLVPMGAALCIAVAVAAGRQIAPRSTAALVLVWCTCLAVWQNAANQQWWAAAKEIKITTKAIANELPKIASTDYAIVLLEDPMGHVPAFRNAQGAIIRAAAPLLPDIDGVNFMVAFLPSQLDEWHGLMQEDVVKVITKRADAPLRPTRFYCKEHGEDSLRYLGIWPAGSLKEWRQQWNGATQKNCPSLKL